MLRDRLDRQRLEERWGERVGCKMCANESDRMPSWWVSCEKCFSQKLTAPHSNLTLRACFIPTQTAQLPPSSSPSRRRWRNVGFSKPAGGRVLIQGRRTSTTNHAVCPSKHMHPSACAMIKSETCSTTLSPSCTGQKSIFRDGFAACRVSSFERPSALIGLLLRSSCGEEKKQGQTCHHGAQQSTACVEVLG